MTRSGHLTLAALKRAVLQRCPGVDLLRESDQGSTYASEDYQDVLAAHGITCRMSREGEVLDDAVRRVDFLEGRAQSTPSLVAGP